MRNIVKCSPIYRFVFHFFAIVMQNKNNLIAASSSVKFLIKTLGDRLARHPMQAKRPESEFRS